MSPLPAVYLPIHGNVTERDHLIKEYFHLGFSYIEILAFLKLYHHVDISMRTLNRILRNLGLRRQTLNIDWDFVVHAVEQELANAGGNLGYRSMHARIRLNHGMIVSRNSVRVILRILDPDGVQARQQRRLRRREYVSKGPGYLFHIDGWDKLKRYGLCVHGAIDGFSRRIMWLEASASNNDASVVCHFFASCIRQQGGTPYFVRADRGTENVNTELMQRILRHENNDDHGRLQTSFLYGTSPANQRIEAYWSKFRSSSMQAWIDHFAQLESIGIIDTSSDIDLQAVRFVYLRLLRLEVCTVMTLWNTHSIRRSTNAQSPSGKPDIMFYLPELYETRSYLIPTDIESLNILSDYLTYEVPDCLPLYREIWESIMIEKQFTLPETLEEAADVLAVLLDTVENDLQNM